MFPECLCMHACLSFEHFLQDILSICRRNLVKLSPLMAFGTWMDASNFGVKRSRVKVSMESNMPQNALFGFVVVTCWRRRNS